MMRARIPAGTRHNRSCWRTTRWIGCTINFLTATKSSTAVKDRDDRRQGENAQAVGSDHRQWRSGSVEHGGTSDQADRPPARAAPMTRLTCGSGVREAGEAGIGGINTQGRSGSRQVRNWPDDLRHVIRRQDQLPNGIAGARTTFSTSAFSSSLRLECVFDHPVRRQQRERGDLRPFQGCQQVILAEARDLRGRR